jgi:DNA-binding NtrC family response regulator
VIALDDALEMEQIGNKLHILVIEEDEATRSACVEIATRKGFLAEGLAEATDARQLLHNRTVDLLLMKLKRDRHEDLRLLEQVKALKPEAIVIVMTSDATILSAVEVMRSGATDFLAKPFFLEQLEAALDRAIEQRRMRSSNNRVGPNQEVDRLYRMLEKLAQSRHAALIVGESGTGKETVARAIHERSEFASQPFLIVECSARAPEQIEYELFGCMEAAFWDPLRKPSGVLASAKHGAVFLDEIGQLTPGLQSKLLHVLQEKEIPAAGTTPAIPFHARVLAASSTDLSAAVTRGTFRKDLYYRLNVVTLRIPPLRERRNDIPLLAKHFLERMSRETGQNYTLSEDALRSMLTYDWPNNIRELENMIERACTVTEGPHIQIGDLPTLVQTHELTLRREKSAQMQKILPKMIGSTSLPRMASLAELEKEAILRAVKQVKGDKMLAAELLGIGKTTMYRKLKEYESDKAVSV